MKNGTEEFNKRLSNFRLEVTSWRFECQKTIYQCFYLMKYDRKNKPLGPADLVQRVNYGCCRSNKILEIPDIVAWLLDSFVVVPFCGQAR